MKTRFFLITTALAVFAFSSCKKDTPVVEQDSAALAKDEVAVDAIFEDVFNTADNATIIIDSMDNIIEAKSETVVPDSCPTISVTHPTAEIWPKLVTVDYGTSCTGLNDNVRSGKILIEVTAPRLRMGSRRTITFDNYYINGIKVEGTKVLENMGYNNNQNLLVSVRLTDGKLTLPGGKTIERSVDHQREWVAGLLTRNIWDDECLITGTATGRSINGISYTNTIITALLWKRQCQFIVSGVVLIERDRMPPFKIDYGTGECDSRAEIIMRNGDSGEILLNNSHLIMKNYYK